MIYWRQASSVAETHGLLGVDVTIVKTIHGVAVVLSCLWIVGLNADALRRIEVQSVVAGVCNWVKPVVQCRLCHCRGIFRRVAEVHCRLRRIELCSEVG